MYSIETLQRIADLDIFRDSYSSVKQALVNVRLRQPSLVAQSAARDLSRFVECTLASATHWPVSGDEAAAGQNLCRIAGELAECLAEHAESDTLRTELRLRSALLYELAMLPDLSSSLLEERQATQTVRDFFHRRGPFFSLGQRQVANVALDSVLPPAFVDIPLERDAIALAVYEQTTGDEPFRYDRIESTFAAQLATFISFDRSATDFAAFAEVVRRRVSTATRSNVSDDLLQLLASLGFPAELRPAQKAAVDGGLLSQDVRAWGFAAPTGSGKTFIARLLIASVLMADASATVLYVVPSRALVNEVATSLSEFVGGMGKAVLSVSAQLIDLDTEESDALARASVVVMTPEKADMLLRINPAFLESVRLVVVDEAHHIEVGTRGVLLELYLWRLKQMLSESARFVFLSAVAPNIKQICDSMGGESDAVVVKTRPTRMRAGVFRLVGKGVKAKGVIEYSDGTSIVVVPERAELQKRRGIAELASFLLVAGPVLTVAKGKGECETLAKTMHEWLVATDSVRELTPDQLASDVYREIDSSLEREMYQAVAMRELLKVRIAYHHAGLPPRVRRGLEAAIRAGLVDFVFATTTLAEGVNFPFSSVIVQSLALKEKPEQGRPTRYSPVTPRVFWNIAGRAGRPGHDREGQVILFEPSLGLNHVKIVLGDYLDPSVNTLKPVESALAASIVHLREAVEAGDVSLAELEEPTLGETVPERVRGAINLLRIGIVHSQAASLGNSPEDIIESTFAATFLSGEDMSFARDVMSGQGEALSRLMESSEFPPIDVVSKLGLSLATLAELRTYVQQMSDSEIEGLARLFFGGTVNLQKAERVLTGVAIRMAELEGRRLYGVYSDLLVNWISGIPFASIKIVANYNKRIEDLISVIYSQIQFLLPWGLYATDTLVGLEAFKRGINYDNTIRRLAYLADAGVPNLDALRLVNLDFERVDATRLSLAYQQAGGQKLGVEILGWLTTRSSDVLTSVIQGQDGRRMAFKFFEHVATIRAQMLGSARR